MGHHVRSAAGCGRPGNGRSGRCGSSAPAAPTEPAGGDQSSGYVPAATAGQSAAGPANGNGAYTLARYL